ncbi:MAG: DUF4832 domain-containing protein [Candidatus Glassbacteria bacterium]|nr:DUF4832 domain-containing protein [Candidatus Glassbacteria bacterium]
MKISSNQGSRLALTTLLLSAALLVYLSGMLAADPESTAGSGAWCREDFNGDGKVLITDVIALLLAARDNPLEPAVDYNRDGKYTVGDAVEMLLNILGRRLTPLEVVVEPVQTDDFLLNPLRGFESKHCFNDWIGRGVPRHPLCGTAQFRWYWDELEPQDGNIRFGMIDSMIARAVENGQKINIRVMCQNGVQHVPQWLRDAGAGGSYYSDGGGWQPDYGDPVFLERHERLVKALAGRYDGHPAVDFVDIGSIGRWGEWHSSETGLNMPTDSIQKIIIDFYLDNFEETPLIALIGDDFAMQYQVENGTGWRADCLGDMGGFSSGWNHMEDFYQQALDASGANEVWKHAPVVFETCWTIQYWYDRHWDLDYILSEALRWHVSIMNNGNEPVPEAWWPAVQEFEKKMGYRFVLRKLKHPSFAEAGDTLSCELLWENRGVAPCYLSHPLAYELRPAAGDTSWVVEDPRADITGWLPGEFEIHSGVVLPEEIPPGEYELGLALLDPADRKPRIRLAVEGRDTDGWYRLSRLRVR